ncbi:translation initiation factor IF-2 subunit alpha [archaeon]|nr:translation initiation factor IF-2 subunit alpha [archaeon]
MFYKKLGFPEEGELVLCTIKKILPNSVFADLDEYQNKEGMIHLSEISAGRIRNIRDYVKENKKIICKVLRTNKERGYIDLSLRRVSLSMRKKKNTECKQEQKAEKILETVAKKLKTDLKDIYQRAGNRIIKEYDLIYPCFQEVSKKGEDVLKEIEIPNDISKVLAEVIKEKIKPTKFKISSTLTLRSYKSDGIEIIKQALLKVKSSKYKIDIVYIGAPNYKITITGQDYKELEKVMKETTDLIINTIEANEGEGIIA